MWVKFGFTFLLGLVKIICLRKKWKITIVLRKTAIFDPLKDGLLVVSTNQPPQRKIWTEKSLTGGNRTPVIAVEQNQHAIVNKDFENIRIFEYI